MSNKLHSSQELPPSGMQSNKQAAAATAESGGPDVMKGSMLAQTALLQPHEYSASSPLNMLALRNLHSVV
jgi:hypothetical protein